MSACVILHNMMVEDERDMYKSLENGNYYLFEEEPALTIIREENNFDFQRFIEGRKKLKDRSQHHHLQEDLVEHLWNFYGNM